MMQTAREDAAVWQLFKDGDTDAYQAIYFQHFHSLYEYGVRLVGDRELVKDGIHDLFVKLWTSKANLGTVTAIRPYLLVSLRATLYNRLEKESRVKLADIQEHPFEMVFSAESDYIRRESRLLQAQQLIDALNQLTPRQKEVVHLRYFEEMEYEEIAAIMNITVKAAYKLTARGLEALHQILNLSKLSLIAYIALVKMELL